MSLTLPSARRALLSAGGGLAAAALIGARRAQAETTRAEIDREVAAAVVHLLGMENAAPLFQHAHAMLVFPKIIAAGFILGGQYGEGALLRGRATQSYYNIAGASFGFLAGAQTSGLAMFFMNEASLAMLLRVEGWEIGTGPSVTFLDRGVQANVTSSTLREPIYAITFSQHGLMAALALNGTKITRITPA
jgi:lipid-binding SYLF domain-containing protein